MKLTGEEIAARLRDVPEWTQEGDTIKRKYTFDGFSSAIAFIVRIGFDAEANDHHPDILLSQYKRVTLVYSTHSAGGLTEKDFRGAAGADQVFEKWAGRGA